MDDDAVLLEVKGGVAVVSLNRPDDHNAMGDEVDALFFRYLDLLRTDRDVRVVVWRANGESFSVGRDIAQLTGDDPDDEAKANGNDDATADGNATGNATGNGKAKANADTNADTNADGSGDQVDARRRRRAAARRNGFGASDFEVLDRAHWGSRLLYDFPVPIICALRGWTLGTALERALLCDVRVAADDAKLALTGVDHGLIPDAGGVAKLFEIGGASLALDLALTGRRLGAEEALRLGLVSQVVAGEDLDATVLDLAQAIADRPPLVTRLVREHVAALATPGVRGSLGRELVGQTMVLASHDFHEQHEAKAEDREPRYERR